METVNFTKMEDGTKEEYAFLAPLYAKCRDGIPEMLLGLLKKMQGDRLGYQIDRYQHSLQTATRAERDGSDEETIVCALLHDIGDVLAPDNHSHAAAAILVAHLRKEEESLPQLWVAESAVSSRECVAEFLRSRQHLSHVRLMEQHMEGPGAGSPTRTVCLGISFIFLLEPQKLIA